MHWSASFCLKIITTVITDISYLTGHGFELTACLPLSLLTTSYSQVVERDFHHVKTVVNCSIWTSNEQVMNNSERIHEQVMSK